MLASPNQHLPSPTCLGPALRCLGNEAGPLFFVLEVGMGGYKWSADDNMVQVWTVGSLGARGEGNQRRASQAGWQPRPGAKSPVFRKEN